MNSRLVQRFQSRLSSRYFAVRGGEQGRMSFVPRNKIVEIGSVNNVVKAGADRIML